MKLILLFLLVFSGFSSDHRQKPVDSFQKGLDLLHHNKPAEALPIFKNILHSESDTTLLYARSFYNVAVCYARLGDHENASKWFIRVMESDFNPRHPSGLYMEDYACYQHNAAIQLSTSFYQQGNMDDALKYILKAEKNYPYLSNKAQAKADRDEWIQLMKGAIYVKTGDYEEAVFLLMQKSLNGYMIHPDHENSLSFSCEHRCCQTPELEMNLIRIVKDHFDPVELKSQLDTALETITIYEDNNHFTAQFTFRERDYSYCVYRVNDKINPNQAYFQSRIRESNFYKFLEK